MRTFAALTLTCFMLSSVPAFAKDEKPVDPDKKICRRAASTGSRMSKPECHTKAEWAAIDENNRQSSQWYADRRGGNAATDRQ